MSGCLAGAHQAGVGFPHVIIMHLAVAVVLEGFKSFLVLHCWLVHEGHAIPHAWLMHGWKLV